MDAMRNGPNPGIKNGQSEQKAFGPKLSVRDTNEWQELADRADLAAEDTNEELERLAGDEADWHPAPRICEETQ